MSLKEELKTLQTRLEAGRPVEVVAAMQPSYPGKYMDRPKRRITEVIESLGDDIDNYFHLRLACGHDVLLMLRERAGRNHRSLNRYIPFKSDLLARMFVPRT